MQSHHLNEDTLLDYATGALPEPVALLAATHLAYCQECRGSVAGYEAVGGALLEGIDPIALAADALEETFSALDGPAGDDADDTPLRDGETDLVRLGIPEPLRGYIGGPLDSLDWNQPARGIKEACLTSDQDAFRVSLMHIDAGRRLPDHTHEGEELTLVLQGGFSDSQGHFGPGDVCVADETVTHAPAVDDDGPCLCLIVVSGRLKLTGVVGRFLNPFIKI